MNTALKVVENSNPSFDDFWVLYPRKVAKKDALKAWAKLTAEQHIQALTACVAWRKVWSTMEMQYICHASTWLNGWRFEDELPVSVTQSAAAHKPAAIPEPAPKSVMPEAVRMAIAKIRGR